MRRIKEKALGALALVSFVALIGLLATPQLYAMLFWQAVTRVEPGERRRAIARWQSWWGTLSFGVVSRILGIRADFRPTVGGDGWDGPCIVIANHGSSLDIIVLFALMARLGRTDLRWILKRQLLYVPAIGRACRETGCGYVTRGGDSGDLDRVRHCAKVARADRASVVIFPEGTRYVSPKRDSGYANVLPPKVGGVLALRYELPDYPVLSVTIRWGAPRGATTVLDGASYVGRTVTVESALRDDVDSRTIAEWLTREWRRKDAALAQKAS